MKEDVSSRRLLRSLKERLPEMVRTLRKIVVAESPSLDKAAADRCCGLIASEWRKLGLRVERVAQKHRGDHLRMSWVPADSRSADAGQILVVGHYDTVYPLGTLRSMPFRVSAGKAYGPGVFDMKAGIVQALFAVEALQRSRVVLQKRVVFLWTSDEEIGSESSRKLIEEEARRSDAVFVMEPAFGPRGLLKTARKGVGEVEIVAHGRASHAGLAPEEGVNAIHELALQIAQIQKWNDARRGVSVNVCVMEGGSRANVIPERARAIFDLRALRATDMQMIEKRLRSLRPVLAGARLEVRGGFNRPPLERKASVELFTRAQKLGKEMGISLGECTVGGGSDGNLTGALGIPTLDGLGAVGDGAHSQHEHIIVRALPVRAALLALLLSSTLDLA